MSVTPLERLLIDTCLDVSALREARRDLDSALEQVGLPQSARNLIMSGQAHSISSVVRANRPQPSAQEIEDYAHARMAVDSIFAMRMRDEARPTLERAFLVRFPVSRSIESEITSEGSLRLRVIDTSTQSHSDSALNSSEPLDPQDIDVDVDTDIEIDIDDVVDIETDIDNIDIDTDTDIDIDTDTVDPSDLASGEHPVVNSRWESYWAERSTLWAELQSQSS